MFVSSSRDKFTILQQNSVTDVSVGFRLVSGWFHVGARHGVSIDEHQHGVSIQISQNLSETFFRVSCLRKTAVTWILARVFAYLPRFLFSLSGLLFSEHRTLGTSPFYQGRRVGGILLISFYFWFGPYVNETPDADVSWHIFSINAII